MQQQTPTSQRDTTLNMHKWYPSTQINLFSWSLLLIISICLSDTATASVRDDDTRSSFSSTPLEPWQSCQIFMAPSVEGMGWGVFAGRTFQEGEIVEMAPGIIPVDHDSPASVDSALWDYAYGYYRLIMPSKLHQRPTIHHMQAVMLGMGMIYNHHPTSPNLEYTTFGREPAPDVPWAANSIGFRALRDIQIGEELFSSYSTKGDGGIEWFHLRNITLLSPPPRRIPIEDLHQWKADFCSKVTAGIGRPTWQKRIFPMLPPHVPFWIDPQWLAPRDAEIGTAFAKIAVSVGQVLEWGSAMVLSQRHHLKGSPLAAIAMRWQDLAPDQQLALQDLRQRGQWMLQYNQWYSDNAWNRTDGLESWDDIALLPFGGTVGLIARGKENSNCRLVIPTESVDIQTNSVVVPLQVVATRDIRSGETLRLDFPSIRMTNELDLLKKELDLMGRIPSIDSFYYLETKDEL